MRMALGAAVVLAALASCEGRYSADDAPTADGGAAAEGGGTVSSDAAADTSSEDASDAGSGEPPGWKAIASTLANAPAAGALVATSDGERLIGFSASLTTPGGMYDPKTDAWTAIPLVSPGEPSSRSSFQVLWADELKRVILFGGYTVAYGGFGDLGKFDPADGGWAYVPDQSPIYGRMFSQAWTGSRYMVWGGMEAPGIYFNDGASFDPATNGWTALPSNANDPGYRMSHTAVWTGKEMIVWGGSRQGTGVIGEGRAFDPDGGTWRQVPAGFAQGRTAHSAFWTGTRMLVFGGSTTSGASLDGALYDPASDTWSNIGLAPLAARSSYSVVWTGAELWVWGGCDAAKCYDDGAIYSPAQNAWRAMPAGGPSARRSHAAVWAHGQMIVWGGFDFANTALADGARLVP